MVKQHRAVLPAFDPAFFPPEVLSQMPTVESCSANWIQRSYDRSAKERGLPVRSNLPEEVIHVRLVSERMHLLVTGVDREGNIAFRIDNLDGSGLSCEISVTGQSGLDRFCRSRGLTLSRDETFVPTPVAEYQCSPQMFPLPTVDELFA